MKEVVVAVVVVVLLWEAGKLNLHDKESKKVNSFPIVTQLKTESKGEFIP